MRTSTVLDGFRDMHANAALTHQGAMVHGGATPLMDNLVPEKSGTASLPNAES
jgi:hypothetical protein